MEGRSFLGIGWSFPVTFYSNGKGVKMSAEEENIAESLEILLSTEHLERLMRPYFGCALRQFVFEELTQGLISRIKDEVTNTIIADEPRIDLVKVDVNKAKDYDNILLINIEYIVRSTNTRSNKVFPFYLKEQSSEDY